MCTAITFSKKGFYFGRTLDLEGTYGYMIDILGARILQTDRPQLMLDYLRSRKLHE